MAVFLRPDADNLDGGWLNQAGNNTDLYTSLDETSASDTDYITSPADPDNQTCRLRLSNPGGATLIEPMVVRYRYNLTGITELRVRLIQGASTVIASWSETTQDAWTTSTKTLTAPQFAAITDFDDLFIEFTANPTVAPAEDYWTPDELGASFWAGYRALETDGTAPVSGTELATSSGAVTTWQNWSTSGAGPDIAETTGTGTRRPTVEAAGYQGVARCLRFVRANGHNLGNLATATITASTAINVFALIAPTAKSGSFDHYVNFSHTAGNVDSWNGDGHLAMAASNNPNKLSSFTGASYRGEFSHTDGASVLWSYITYNETTQMRVRPRRNGDWMGAGETLPNSLDNFPVGDQDVFRIGASTRNSATNIQDPGSMDLFELVVVTGNMSDADIEKVEGYLAWKAHRAGYTGTVTALPSGHPYKAGAPEL